MEEILRKVERFGYAREFVIKSINQNSCNHASACYALMYREYMDLNGEKGDILIE